MLNYVFEQKYFFGYLSGFIIFLSIVILFFEKDPKIIIFCEDESFMLPPVNRNYSSPEMNLRRTADILEKLVTFRLFSVSTMPIIRQAFKIFVALKIYVFQYLVV